MGIFGCCFGSEPTEQRVEERRSLLQAEDNKIQTVAAAAVQTPPPVSERSTTPPITPPVTPPVTPSASGEESLTEGDTSSNMSFGDGIGGDSPANYDRRGAFNVSDHLD